MATSSGLAAAKQNKHPDALLWFADAVRLASDEPERQELNRIRVSNWLRTVPRPVRVFRIPDFSPLQSRFRVFDFHPLGEHLIVLTNSDRCFLWDLVGDSLLPLPTGDRPLSSAAWGPTGDRLALGSTKGNIALYSFPELRLVERWQAQGKVFPLAFSPNGRFLAWGEARGVQVWDCSERSAATPLLPHPRPVSTLTFNPQGTRLATSCEDLRARVFRLPAEGERSEPLFAPVAHAGGEVGVAHGGRDGVAPLFVNQGRELITVTNGRVPVWREADTGKVVRTIPEPSAGSSLMVTRVCPFGRYLALLWATRGSIWDVMSGKEIGSFDHHHEWSEDAHFDPTGQTLCTCGHDTAARFWSPSKNGVAPIEPTTPPMRHPAIVVRVRYSPAARVLATARVDGVVTVWRLPPPYCPDWALPQGGATRVCFSPDGRHFLASGVNHRSASLRTTRVYEASSGQPAGPLLEPGGILLDAVFTPDGQRVVTASSAAKTWEDRQSARNLPPGAVQLWHWKSGRRLGAPISLQREPRGLAYSPNGEHLAVICADGWLVLLRGSDGEVLHRIDTGNRATSNAHLWTANGLARFSPDSRWLVTWEMDNVVRVWDPATGRLLHTLAHEGRVADVDFGNEPSCLITAARDAKVRLWDLRTGNLLVPPLAHPRIASAARRAPDGKQLLSVCEDGAVRAWDERTGQLLAAWKQNQMTTQDFAVSPDNRWLITAAVGDSLVLDRHSGTPITPRLVNNFVNLSVRIDSEGRRAVVGGFQQSLEMFDLQALTTPSAGQPEEMTLLAELIAGHRIQSTGELAQLSAEEWWQRWQKLRQNWPHHLAWPEVAARSRPPGKLNMLLEDALRLTPNPSTGSGVEVTNVIARPGQGPGGTDCVELDGQTSRLVYRHPGVPGENYTLSLWVQPLRWPQDAPCVVCGSWTQPYDAPLELHLAKGRLSGRVLAGQVYQTGSVPVEPDRWMHVALVKSGTSLTLYVGGRRRGEAVVPQAVVSSSTLLALGSNPPGTPLGLQARFARITLVDQALSPHDVARLATR